MIQTNFSGGKTSKQEPPKVLIDLAMIRQMRRRRQMLEELRQWIESQQQSGEPADEVQA